MKKKIVIGIVAILLIAAVIFALLPRVSVDPSGKASARFLYENADIRVVLEEEDAKAIADIVNGKILKNEIYPNSFSEDISVTIDGVTFCPARKIAPVMYVWEKNRYIELSNEENNTIRTILESYGFIFPCM